MILWPWEYLSKTIDNKLKEIFTAFPYITEIFKLISITDSHTLIAVIQEFANIRQHKTVAVETFN